MTGRAELVGALAEHLAQRRPGHPLRVGIDGVCGAGKTRFADDLAAALRDRGCPVVRLDSDGFHHRRARRRAGADPARGYYDDAYDFEALRDRVLVPLGPDGDLRYATAVHDLASDAVLDSWAQAPADAVLIFDCTFLQRGDLRALWDDVIFLDVDLGVAKARGVARDAAALGGEAAAATAYDARYLAACRLYLAEERPAERASVVVRHDDPHAPEMVAPEILALRPPAGR